MALINTSPGFFGFPLDNEVPIVVCDCISFLTSRGLNEVGIFKFPGDDTVVSHLKERYNSKFPTEFMKKENPYSVLNKHNPSPSVHDVATLLKHFFNELEQKLIPEDVAQDMVQVFNESSNEQSIVIGLSSTVMRMPKRNRACFSFLISFLRQVLSFKEKNEIQDHELAAIWSPILFNDSSLRQQQNLFESESLVLENILKSDVKLYLPSNDDVQTNTRFKN